MGYCKNCGSELSDGEKFCSGCGTELTKSKKFCSECGTEIKEGKDFCSNCGKNMGEEKQKKVDKTEGGMRCPYCGSHNISVQVVSSSKRTGCFVIFLYVLLAITIVGIPIMFLILLLKGKKTVTEKHYICQGCGRSLNPRQLNSDNVVANNSTTSQKKGLPTPLKIVLFSFLGFIGTISLISAIVTIVQDNSFISYDQYTELNPQELYNDYINDAGAASKKYDGNYYYFNGVIEDKVDMTADDYLLMSFSSANDSEKVFHFNAYYFSETYISNAKKDDAITIYCKFKGRDKEDNFIFRSCRTKNVE